MNSHLDEMRKLAHELRDALEIIPVDENRTLTIRIMIDAILDRILNIERELLRIREH